eukprot:10412324-Prorocentrum_lima.AAC.1
MPWVRIGTQLTPMTLPTRSMVVIGGSVADNTFAGFQVPLRNSDRSLSQYQIDCPSVKGPSEGGRRVFWANS